MVIPSLYIALVAFHVCFFVRWIFGKCFFAISHSVRLDIGLCHYIDTVLVAKVIPQIVVRIVTGTYRVNVQLLHTQNILQHAFTGNHVSSVRIHFVAVGTFKEHRLPVHQYLSALQFNFAETYFYRDHFQRVAAVFQGCGQCI